jgi:hypothetical protein
MDLSASSAEMPVLHATDHGSEHSAITIVAHVRHVIQRPMHKSRIARTIDFFTCRASVRSIAKKQRLSAYKAA